MRTSFEHRSVRGPSAALAWPGAALALASLLPLVVGCQTTSTWSSAARKQTSRPDSAPSDPTVAKSDFHREVTPDQQYNMHMEFGRVLESEKQYDAAMAEYQKALEACARRGLGSGVKGSGAKQALAHRRMGGALDRMGRFTQAESHYQLALKASPDDANVWNDSGYSYYMQSRWTDAERNLKTAARLAPDNVRIQTNLGLVLAATGKTDEALMALSKAGGTAIGHANLGYLLAAMGQRDRAREHYETALQLQPNLGPARQALTALNAQGARTEQVATTTVPLAPSSDMGIQRVSSPQPKPVTVPLETIADPRMVPVTTPPRSVPSSIAPAAPLSIPLSAPTSSPLSQAPTGRRDQPVAMKPSPGPRATPVAVTPQGDTRTRGLATTTPVAAAPRTTRLPGPAAADSHATKPSGPLLSRSNLTSPTRPTSSDPGVARVSLPPVYDPRTAPRPKSSAYDRTALPPVYGSASAPAAKPPVYDPRTARVSLPPVYDPRSFPAPKATGTGPRPVASARPPVSGPRGGRAAKDADTDIRVLSVNATPADSARSPSSTLPPVYDPRNPPAATPGTSLPK